MIMQGGKRYFMELRDALDCMDIPTGMSLSLIMKLNSKHGFTQAFKGKSKVITMFSSGHKTNK